MRDLQPFIKNISCGKCLVSPAKEEVEAVSTCPSSASAKEGYVCSTPRQSESSDGSHLKFNKVVKKKKSFHSFNKGENFKPYKFSNTVLKAIL